MPHEQSLPSYALSLRLKDIPVLLVGGGAVAQSKAAALQASGAALTIISPTLTAGLMERARAGAIVHVARSYEEGDIVRLRPRLVFAATSSAQVNRAVAREAERHSVWVNVVSAEAGEASSGGPVRGAGTFASSAVVRRGALGIAVSTDGSSPLLARAVREWLDERLGQEWAALAEWAAAARCRAACARDANRGRIGDGEVLAALRSWLRGDAVPLRLVHGRMTAIGIALPDLPRSPELERGHAAD